MAFNGTTPTESVVRQAVELACRAPSLHNSQPWLWEYHDGKLYLFADESRILDLTDPKGRQLVISCGAALHHVRIVLASVSWAPRVHRLPDPERPQLLAVLEFDRQHSVHPREATLALAISQRHADRRPFMEPTSLGGTLAALEAAAREEHAYLVILDSDAHADMAKASALSTSIRKYDAAYKAELTWWTGHIAAEQGVSGVARSDRGSSRDLSADASDGVGWQPRHRARRQRAGRSNRNNPASSDQVRLARSAESAGYRAPGDRRGLLLETKRHSLFSAN